MSLAALAGPLFIIVSASGYYFAPLPQAAVIQFGMLTLISILLATVILDERPSKSIDRSRFRNIQARCHGRLQFAAW